MVFAARAVRKDPPIVTPSDLDLPRAWPDYIFRRLGAFLGFLRTLLFGGRKVVLPPDLPGGKALPGYLLREFHRMPNGYYSHMLADGYERGFEVRRLLRPGGRIVISEPSAEQMRNRSFVSLWRRHGGRGVYYRLLALLVTEPYVEQWHGRNVAEWAAQHGFAVENAESVLPFSRIVLRRL